MARRIINTINMQGVSILKQLCIEELLLRQSCENWFLFNSNLTETSIIVGFSGKIGELIHVREAHARSTAVIRRYTGGGTVVVDENTILSSLIMNVEHVPSLPYPRDIMNWTEKMYKPIFDSFGASNFSLRENDYVLDDRKVGGNAQTITRNRWVHHTSFLWGINPNNMKLLQLPKKRPTYRNDRSHTEFLTTLKEHVTSRELFESRVLQELNEHYDVQEWNQVQLQSRIDNILREQGKLIEDLTRTKLENLDEHLSIAT